ncbi:serine/threonine-protein kinase [Saccharothrix xinjiangensis]|uniref:non-specific serine/threonine protein kinase n=1 Tax=Saccharothrix xinjiangensis TaxID=204798 RepID=A0ABV9Y6Z0_9PSEU
MHDELSRYRLVRLLGRGGMGEVHVAEDTSRHDRQVALKLLSTTALSDPELEKRFRRECELAAQIDHPNVLPVYDYSVGENPYIVMRYVDGTDLSTVLRQHGALPAERAVAITEQVAAALDAAHRKHLRHRDVKPSNVLLEPGARHGTDHAWLFDWGIAQPITAQQITRLGQVVGTPHYIAPERLAGERPADHRADVYSLAVVLYECLAGRRPFEGDDMVVLAGHLHRPPDPLPAAVPAGLRAVVVKGLAKDPDERYQAAGELAAAARAALEERSGHAKPDPATPGPPPAARDLRGVAVGGAGGGALGVLLAVTGLLDGTTALWTAVALVAAGALLAYGLHGDGSPDPGPAPGDPTRDADPGGFPRSRP